MTLAPLTCDCGHGQEVHFPYPDGGGFGPCFDPLCNCMSFALAAGEVRAPDVLGEIHGWRAWEIRGNRHHPRLHSVTWSSFWPTSEWTVAECHGESECGSSLDGRVPGESCTCGIYCAKHRSHLTTLGYNAYGDGWGARPKVIGIVGLAGKVIPGTQGWRAEKARVVELRLPYEFRKFAAGLESEYGAAVTLDNTWESEEKPERLQRYSALQRRLEAKQRSDALRRKIEEEGR